MVRHVIEFCVTSRESKDQPAASPSAGGSLPRADTWNATKMTTATSPGETCATYIELRNDNHGNGEILNDRYIV